MVNWQQDARRRRGRSTVKSDNCAREFLKKFQLEVGSAKENVNCYKKKIKDL